VLHGCILEVHCPSLPPVDGATISYTDGNFAPSVATYSCDAYVKPPQDGNASRTCQADGSWSGVAPTRCCAGVVHPVTGACIPGALDFYQADGFTWFQMEESRLNYGDTAHEATDWYANICTAAGLHGVGCENENYNQVNGLAAPGGYSCNINGLLDQRIAEHGKDWNNLIWFESGPNYDNGLCATVSVCSPPQRMYNALCVSKP